MQNPIPKLKQSSIISEKPGYLSEKLKIWRAPTTIGFNVFCWNFAHVSYLRMSTKWYSDFFLDLELLSKNVKNECA